MENRLYLKYVQEIVPRIKRLEQLSSVMQVPRLEKIVINSGIGDAIKNKQAIPEMVDQLARITGQKPIVIMARQSVSTFRLRAGMPIGIKVTLRRKRMYDFLEKLLNVALMQVRDFRGLKTTSFDKQGNYNFGVREQIIFPEINYEQVTKTRGFDFALVTSTTDRRLSLLLLKELGLPFNR